MNSVFELRSTHRKSKRHEEEETGHKVYLLYCNQVSIFGVYYPKIENDGFEGVYRQNTESSNVERIFYIFVRTVLGYCGDLPQYASEGISSGVLR